MARRWVPSSSQAANAKRQARVPLGVRRRHGERRKGKLKPRMQTSGQGKDTWLHNPGVETLARSLHQIAGGRVPSGVGVGLPASTLDAGERGSRETVKTPGDLGRGEGEPTQPQHGWLGASPANHSRQMRGQTARGQPSLYQCPMPTLAAGPDNHGPTIPHRSGKAT